MLGLPASQAYLILLICVLPVCAWVCWSDLRSMRIPNVAVFALVGIYAVVGVLVLPFEFWAWRWLNLVVVLAIGFVLNAVAHFGAGDAKFAAAAAPFIPAAHAALVLPLFAAFLLGAFSAHRLLRAIPAIRRMTPDWVSWTRKDFPMGLALVGTLVAYLAIRAFLPEA
ncbi:prepilin peptidase [Defluviimonas sp. WL0024]|uniref:Prepilin peptidase n=1 Tax=Albidovulum salinarum TaxID=2984153 RepID=A0ABT2X017_9RHOB|nr:prepilin peptidase [Defluviimonas sp. WL0024]MCU9847266.1 prepilin peptidase [Defluviimonas sp. WL0024]